MTASGDKSLYPQIPRAREVPTNVQNDTLNDAEMARQLQAQYDQGQLRAVAQPVQHTELPYKCGNCGVTHVVRHVTHGSTFQCTACSAQNQILLEPCRSMVEVYVDAYDTAICCDRSNDDIAVVHGIASYHQRPLIRHSADPALL